MTRDWRTRHAALLDRLTAQGHVANLGFALYAYAHLPGVRLAGKRRGGSYHAWVDDGRGSAAQADGSGHVWEYGPRALWEELEKLWGLYREAGAPEASAFGLSVTARGQRVWLRDPGVPVGTAGAPHPHRVPGT
ncbi:hypothetical protein [Streptomyces iconiensis]|uniref:Uncharacterized protein n=1 Tax=Streptomyces iconiensis TaxID=1384038 RepID=A0ABT6ZWG7_9ACTN|nr:hypothetical protein [Streptomyces iconiensis]MDJ1133412.1 hypothetical protein [Streptomyces iconiensis]